ncbi:MAG: class I SAM-dependent methyltransferase, partial [Candidatus Wolfebacteria bacterium]|nr:class I SAM-dependent methyltransferase [Candidatus Wolfebacteria bacterium]
MKQLITYLLRYFSHKLKIELAPHMNLHYKQWKKDEATPFKGWKFSYTKDRIVWEEPSWDYQAIAKELVQNSKSVLDIATGGGERFSALAPFPSHTVAIEGWHPNVEVAEEELKPLGAQVLEIKDAGPYPFHDEEFDLVLNRHGGLAIQEIARILQPGGQFLTQQVDGRDMEDLQAFFGAKPKWPDNNLEEVSKKLIANGFTIKQAESWIGRVTFLDVGALVYHLTNIPWIVEGFSVDTHLKYLEALQEKLDRGEKLTYTVKRFLLWCEKE